MTGDQELWKLLAIADRSRGFEPGLVKYDENAWATAGVYCYYLNGGNSVGLLFIQYDPNKYDLSTMVIVLHV